MDTISTLFLINDPSERPTNRADSLQELAKWLHAGGDCPMVEGDPFTAETQEAAFEEGWHVLLASVRVAIAYGDNSGLDFHFGPSVI